MTDMTAKLFLVESSRENLLL